MKDIIIVCAGCYGMEAYTIIESLNDIARRRGSEVPYHVLGFIDDKDVDMSEFGIREKVIGPIHGWKPIGDEVYAIGAAQPGVKEKLATLLKAEGCRFETLIAPWSIVSPNVSLGEGCMITAYSISSGARLGSFVNINGSMICAGAEIGDYTTTTGFTVVERAIVERSVFIGSHAVIKEGVRVGEKANISAGSIVTEDVQPGALMFGVPAEAIG